MFEFELDAPFMLLLLPLPILVYWLAPAYRIKKVALFVPFFHHLAVILNASPQEGAQQLTPAKWQKVMLVISWSLIVIGLSQPTTLGEPQVREVKGRDLMVVVDISGSMATQDFSTSGEKPTDRLQATKSVLNQFVKTRVGDRLGLILFASAAYVQAPFTADHNTWLELLHESQIGMAGESTHFGDAIGLAIKTFEGSDSAQKVALILTDGNDTDSLVPPVDAAKVAAAQGIKLYVVAMGDPELIGETALDMAVIETVASITGGQHFTAQSPEELDAAYQHIDQLEPSVYQSTTFRPKISQHYLSITLIPLMYLIAFSLATLRRQRRYLSIKGR